MKFRAAIARLAGAAVLLCISAGCATQIYPPARAKLAAPVPVYICDYGVHSSLLLPSGNGQFVEYVYGDWDFAALNETDPLHILAALFDSHQAALGRRFLAAPSTGAPLPPNRPRHIQAVLVDAGKVQTVVQELDARYRKALDTAWFNDEDNYDFLFVKDDQHYGLFNNCNTLTSHTLAEMGCSLSGQAVLSRFEVVQPRPAAMPDTTVMATPVTAMDASPP